MNLPAKHGRHAPRAQSLGDREEAAIQVPSAAGEWQLAAKPDGELDRKQAVQRNQSRRSYGLSMIQETGQPDLTRAPAPIPAGQPRLDAQ